jgi:hypothetical protein
VDKSFLSGNLDFIRPRNNKVTKDTADLVIPEGGGGGKGKAAITSLKNYNSHCFIDVFEILFPIFYEHNSTFN